jgi:hypothetical protein
MENVQFTSDSIILFLRKFYCMQKLDDLKIGDMLLSTLNRIRIIFNIICYTNPVKRVGNSMSPIFRPPSFCRK